MNSNNQPNKKPRLQNALRPSVYQRQTGNTKQQTVSPMIPVNLPVKKSNNSTKSVFKLDQTRLVTTKGPNNTLPKPTVGGKKSKKSKPKKHNKIK
jgi:hypothetical protein